MVAFSSSFLSTTDCSVSVSKKFSTNRRTILSLRDVSILQMSRATHTLSKAETITKMKSAFDRGWGGYERYQVTKIAETNTVTTIFATVTMTFSFAPEFISRLSENIDVCRLCRELQFPVYVISYLIMYINSYVAGKVF